MGNLSVQGTYSKLLPFRHESVAKSVGALGNLPHYTRSVSLNVFVTHNFIVSCLWKHHKIITLNLEYLFNFYNLKTRATQSKLCKREIYLLFPKFPAIYYSTRANEIWNRYSWTKLDNTIWQNIFPCDGGVPYLQHWTTIVSYWKQLDSYKMSID